MRRRTSHNICQKELKFVELSEALRQHLLEIFSQLPYEQWDERFQEICQHNSELQKYSDLPSYDLLIELMEYSFGQIVSHIDPIVSDPKLDTVSKLQLLTKAFIKFAMSDQYAYRIAFLVRPAGNTHEHIPVESAIRFRVLIRKVFRSLSQQHSRTEPLELQVQGLMCVLNGIVVSSLFLQRMDLIEVESLSSYVTSHYLRGILQENFPQS